jgi:hypothetical protein
VAFRVAFRESGACHFGVAVGALARLARGRGPVLARLYGGPYAFDAVTPGRPLP